MLSAALHSTTSSRHTLHHHIHCHLISRYKGSSGLFDSFQQTPCQHVKKTIGPVSYRSSLLRNFASQSRHCLPTRSRRRLCSSLFCQLQQYSLTSALMAGQAGYSMHSAHSMHSSAACRAYVGEATPAAGEYHCEDFNWDDLRQEAEALLAARTAQQQGRKGSTQANKAALQAHDPSFNLKLASLHVTRSPDVVRLQQQQQQHKQQHHDQQQQHNQQQQHAGEGLSRQQYDKGCWEAFHARDNATARFYKERRYLLLEFPALTVTQPPQHFLEIGCGCGSSLLPVLKANPTCSVIGTDLSPTAVAMFKQAAAKAGIAADRFTGYAADSTLPADSGSIDCTESGEAHAVLLIFTLAAVQPLEMPAMLHTAFQALRPGGLLLVRDHGLYDLTHLRLPPEQQLADKLYRRLDGTTCYFFTKEDLQAKAEDAGFTTQECKYACTNLFNRKRQLNMKRVFVHGVFQKPLGV